MAGFSKRYMSAVGSLYGDTKVNVKLKAKPKIDGGQLSEAREQIKFVAWLQKNQIPAYHPANGGKRNLSEAYQLKLMGVSPGVPDICIPRARKGYFGLYLELKRKTGGVLSEAQKYWLRTLNDEGYLAKVAFGCDEAIAITYDYLTNDKDVV